MIGHKVDDHLHPGVMRAGDKSLKLPYAVIDLNRDVRIHVIVILYRIGRSSLALDHGGIIAVYAVGAVVGLIGMFDYSRIPHVSHAKVSDAS